VGGGVVGVVVNGGVCSDDVVGVGGYSGVGVEFAVCYTCEDVICCW